ncbi:MAG TPA: Gfo/Idh/MocA family oxidoreductase [Microthrixaceae bacterium]|nr:Gfo/Idh/MocA family oxidoreductase [Microthrixaceae bacterium]
MASLRLGVIGIEHLHLFEMVDQLAATGFETVCHVGQGSLEELYRNWRGNSELRTPADIIGDDSLDLVVLAGVPSTRAATAVAAMHAGRHVLVAKPAVTSADDLALIDRTARSTGRRWWVFFSERLSNRAITKAVELVGAGAIGDLVSISGWAPHSLQPTSRPDWFFNPMLSGGILVDLAAHQGDQLLALAGPGITEVASATVRNAASPTCPQFQDIGRMSLRHTTASGRVVLSDHHVDWLSPSGLGTWGDVRLNLVGAAGTIEVRSNIDVTGIDGSEHLILVDGDGARRIDCTATDVDWAARLSADIASGSDSLMSHEHAVSACELTLRAQAVADGSYSSGG